MHIKIKINDTSIKHLYENHSAYHKGDSGLDIFTPSKNVIMPHSKGTIDTGIACEATIGAVGTSFWMLSRSSVATKTPLILANSMGLIDAGYRGNLMGVFYNTSDTPFVVDKGTRLLQICAPDLKPITFELVDELSNTTRGTGGYGSTGN